MSMKAMMIGAGLMLGDTSAAASIEFDWLSGHWCGRDAERRIDEVWLPEAGGALLGMSRTLNRGVLESYEFMRLVPAGQHVGLHVQPNGVTPVVFAISESGVDWVVFKNQANDFPNRIEYRRNGVSLTATISGPGEDEERLEVAFDYRRCDG
ncbi:DUF6265 family protein [Stenotrophomonas sp. G106K1]|uniref:DUF6265 family protein n=1 Tax=Stenotrophomonas sp. G106K1 TaxID=3134792 RepID=UPI0030F38274